jgi:hypothetical protein
LKTNKEAVMKKRIFVTTFGLLLIAASVFAGDGDLIVNGKIGAGTATQLQP